MAYKRVLLKISGEQLAGQFDGGFDGGFATWLAKEISKVLAESCQVVIMVGGGNYARGAQLATHGIKRVTADFIGMLGTMMNALAVCDVFNNAGVESWALSSVAANLAIDQFTHRRASNHLDKGRVVIVAGGIGRPYVTTDTAAVELALEMDCEVVLKATKVDGVYDKDPVQFADAKKYEHLTFSEVLANNDIRVMDRAAIGLASDHSLPIIVFNGLQQDNIIQAVRGEPIGTKISH